MIRPDTSSLIDIHSHLVPGVDDGARNVEGVLAAIERLTQAGIRRLVTTPHIDASLTLDPPRLEERLDEVTRAWEVAAGAIKDAFPEVEYRRGHEILLDVPEADFSDDRMRMAGTPFVLVEWPRLHVPPGTPRVLRWIRDQGYLPIVAHPERYGGMVKTPELPFVWREAGAFLQVNYGSFVGRYGSEAQAVAWRLVESGVADYMASDFHGQSGLKIYKREAWVALEERGGGDILETLCRVNPGRLLGGVNPLPVAPLPRSRSIFSRLRSMMTGGVS